jgi:hypothetical protein
MHQSQEVFADKPGLLLTKILALLLYYLTTYYGNWTCVIKGW